MRPSPSFSVTHVRGGGAARGRKTVLNRPRRVGFQPVNAGLSNQARWTRITTGLPDKEGALWCHLLKSRDSQRVYIPVFIYRQPELVLALSMSLPRVNLNKKKSHSHRSIFRQKRRVHPVFAYHRAIPISGED